MQANINRNQLFVASCLALLVTSLSFGIRAGLLGTWIHEFGLTAEQAGIITSTAFWGFPLAIIIGGMVVDIIGMKKLLLMAAVFHFLGIILTITATGFWSLFISTLLIGLGNGTVEAACNPLVASLYTDKKTTKLNHFHLWFPGGIVIGTLIVKLLGVQVPGTDFMQNWKFLVAIMLIPTVLYGYLFAKREFPVTERVASGVSTREMYASLLNPLFILMVVLMLGTAITELFTGQWIDVLLKNVTDNALLLLTIETGVMVLGRAFAGPVVGRFSATGVLLMSAIVSTIGLYMLGHFSGNMLFVGALVFGIGVCYFWPTMIGFVAENLPRTGAVGLNLVGGAGMFGVSLYTIFISGYYDRLLASKLPAGADLATYNAAPPGSDLANALVEAKRAAGPEIINVTMVIPIILSIVFAGLFFYMKSKSKGNSVRVASSH
ncbi:MFS transporter [Flavihumibacter petaseus]|uniref:Putative major facilitator superfamily transporter n=1 Tax=Flavihumibacter petaseus NBRC 106054 TaxID=1220578 RepID=A0A0E9N318_9BACT|nr:MFS transporter [Flavihumibacter petaseus]GAO44229.1 putative major facilitator superfamily transporter [Flavihumibacter petaseus NBRC 106054]